MSNWNTPTNKAANAISKLNGAGIKLPTPVAEVIADFNQFTERNRPEVPTDTDIFAALNNGDPEAAGLLMARRQAHSDLMVMWSQAVDHRATETLGGIFQSHQKIVEAGRSQAEEVIERFAKAAALPPGHNVAYFISTGDLPSAQLLTGLDADLNTWRALDGARRASANIRKPDDYAAADGYSTSLYADPTKAKRGDTPVAAILASLRNGAEMVWLPHSEGCRLAEMIADREVSAEQGSRASFV